MEGKYLVSTSPPTSIMLRLNYAIHRVPPCTTLCRKKHDQRCHERDELGNPPSVNLPNSSKHFDIVFWRLKFALYLFREITLNQAG